MRGMTRSLLAGGSMLREFASGSKPPKRYSKSKSFAVTRFQNQKVLAGCLLPSNFKVHAALGGWLCGHDYTPKFQGVIDAVTYFCQSRQLTLGAVTRDGGYPSYGIEKPSR